MERSPTSHKGENGIVAVIGGSAGIHGAPILAALAAEASGVDLVFVALPNAHVQLARAAALNFQVRGWKGDAFSKADVKPLLEWLATMDACVIGPGMDRSMESIEALYELVASCPCPMVLDASALQPWTLEAAKGHRAILTPHLGELERMGIAPNDIATEAQKHEAVIHLKGAIDRIATSDGTAKDVVGGNQGLTVGGTGDVLAGLTAGLLAQRVPMDEASILATSVVKKAGDALMEDNGYAYRAVDVIRMIPRILREQIDPVVLHD